MSNELNQGIKDTMRAAILTAAFFLLGVAHAQQQTLDYQSALALYQQVITGARSLDSLTPAERQSVLLVARVMRDSRGGNSRKCEAVADAADELESAARNLASCASGRDFSDDCGTQFRSVQSAHSDYEDAVSEADGDCE